MTSITESIQKLVSVASSVESRVELLRKFYLALSGQEAPKMYNRDMLQEYSDLHQDCTRMLEERYPELPNEALFKAYKEAKRIRKN